MLYICYARELGLRKGAWPQSQATCRRAATARSQPTVGFQLAFWSAYALRRGRLRSTPDTGFSRRDGFARELLNRACFCGYAPCCRKRHEVRPALRVARALEEPDDDRGSGARASTQTCSERPATGDCLRPWDPISDLQAVPAEINRQGAHRTRVPRPLKESQLQTHTRDPDQLRREHPGSHPCLIPE